jgi:hypothetical protein
MPPITVARRVMVSASFISPSVSPDADEFGRAYPATCGIASGGKQEVN